MTIPGFMNAMEKGVLAWLAEVRNDTDTDKRREDALSKLLQYRPNGEPPHITGIPVIS